MENEQENAIISFEDVPPGSVYYNAIAWAVYRGITAGTSSNTFSPHKTCTRQEVLLYIWRAMGAPEMDDDLPYTDLDADSIFGKAALWAYQNELETGDNSQFNGQIVCTRIQAMTYLWKLAGMPNKRITFFQDISYGNATEEELVVEWAVKNRISIGITEYNYGPNGTVNRGQFMVFLYRYFQNIDPQ